MSHVIQNMELELRIPASRLELVLFLFVCFFFLTIFTNVYVCVSGCVHRSFRCLQRAEMFDSPEARVPGG